jgi:hypothetical protein
MLCPEESGYPGHLTGVVKRLPPEIASLATACTYLCTYVHRCKGCLQNFDAPETFSPLAFRLQTVCVFRTFYRKSISAELKVHDYVPLKTPRKVILKTLCLQEGLNSRSVNVIILKNIFAGESVKKLPFNSKEFAKN